LIKRVHFNAACFRRIPIGGYLTQMDVPATCRQQCPRSQITHLTANAMNLRNARTRNQYWPWSPSTRGECHCDLW